MSADRDCGVPCAFSEGGSRWGGCARDANSSSTNHGVCKLLFETVENDFVEQRL